MVYCKSDGAPLCLKCDGCVHSANALSRRHLRSLICDRCFSQAAVVRCLDDKISLCHDCEGGCFLAEHRRVKLSFYSGCPSITEFSKIWSFVLEGTSSQQDLAVVNGGNESSSGGMLANTLNEIAPSVFGQWSIPSPPPPPPPPPQLPPKYALSYNRDQRLTSFNRDHMPFLPQESTLHKVIIISWTRYFNVYNMLDCYVCLSY